MRVEGGVLGVAGMWIRGWRLACVYQWRLGALLGVDMGGELVVGGYLLMTVVWIGCHDGGRMRGLPFLL